MPLPNTIFWLILHLCFAVGCNYFLREMELIGHGEFISIYFVWLAGKYRDAQVKFTQAYREDPDLTEALMRAELTKDNLEGI